MRAFSASFLAFASVFLAPFLEGPEASSPPAVSAAGSVEDEGMEGSVVGTSVSFAGSAMMADIN